MNKEENNHKLKFVQQFALYSFFMMVGDTIMGFVISDPEYGRVFSIAANSLAGVGIGLSFYFSSKRGQLLPAAWLLIGSFLGVLGYYSLVLGAHTYIFVAFLIPLAIALAVLPLKITIILAVAVEAWGGLWGGLQFIAVYKPDPVSSNTLTLINASVCAMLIPLLMAILYIPTRQREQLLIKKNKELTQTLEALTARQDQALSISQVVAGLSEALRTSSLQQSSGSSQEFYLLSLVNAAVTELVNTAGSIAEATQEANRNAEIIGEAGQGIVQMAEKVAYWSTKGTEAVESAVSLNATAGEKQRKLTEDIQSMLAILLETRKLSELIKKVAQETHILSLNLAIEAAGSGGAEGNPRMKTLATSIRTLAQSTATSNDEITKLLSNLENAAQVTQNSLSDAAAILSESVKASQEAGAVIETLYDVSQASNGEIQTISQQLLSMVALISQIKVATLAQRDSCDGVSMSLHELTILAQENVAVSKGVADSSKELAGVASTLVA